MHSHEWHQQHLTITNMNKSDITKEDKTIILEKKMKGLNIESDRRELDTFNYRLS